MPKKILEIITVIQPLIQHQNVLAMTYYSKGNTYIRNLTKYLFYLTEKNNDTFDINLNIFFCLKPELF